MRIHRLLPAFPLAWLAACGAGPQPAEEEAAAPEFADAEAALIAEAMSAAP